jgi:hypothetical protein
MTTEVPGETLTPSYFLISVSTRENLDLCIQYALAGFPSGESGAWTFCEIEKGDFVSFLYGARVYNLYRVAEREALSAADKLPPWQPLVFRETGRSYSFPFRLHLQPVRIFSESLVRAEFSYVGENLLLRGGYRKSHFQADQTTLQSVSEMGTRFDGLVTPLSLPDHSSFILRFTRAPELLKMPETCRFTEPILQSAIRRNLMHVGNLRTFLSEMRLPVDQVEGLEILGEKAIPLGHIDLLLKQRVPLGSTLKIPLEVKTKRAQPDDVSQLGAYMDELGDDCQVGVLVAADFAKSCAQKLTSDLMQTPTFEEIFEGLTLEPVGN